MRIVFAGPGALGSFFAARMYLQISRLNNTHDLWLLDYNKNRAKTLNSKGIILEEGPKQTKCLIQVTHDPKIIGKCDVLFLSVKSHAVPDALSHAVPLLGEDTVLISMQNGISHIDAIQQTIAIPVAAIISEGAALHEPGHVIHGGAGITKLGFLNTDKTEDKGKTDSIIELLNQAGIKTVKINNTFKHIWAKLFANIGINALTALHDVPNGKLLDSTTTREIMKGAVNEAMKVADKLGIDRESDPVENTFEICKKTSHNISSMLQDVRKKRRTEIDAINGAIIAAGKKLNIATPINIKLVNDIKKLENSYLIN